jgi:PKD repeat protein
VVALLGCSSEDDPTPNPNAYTPIVSFDYTISYTGSVARVTFINGSENADRYYWEFGDYNTSTEKNPSHDYPLPAIGHPKTYLVKLTAYDDKNETSATKSRGIEISQQP